LAIQNNTTPYLFCSLAKPRDSCSNNNTVYIQVQRGLSPETEALFPQKKSMFLAVNWFVQAIVMTFLKSAAMAFPLHYS
jgi:hypothetical protein